MVLTAGPRCRSITGQDATRPVADLTVEVGRAIELSVAPSSSSRQAYSWAVQQFLSFQQRFGYPDA